MILVNSYVNLATMSNVLVNEYVNLTAISNDLVNDANFEAMSNVLVNGYFNLVAISNVPKGKYDIGKRVLSPTTCYVRFVKPFDTICGIFGVLG